jgi:hypothetical protein
MKQNEIRFLLSTTYKMRSLMLRGVARRLINCGRNSSIANDLPSLTTVVNEVLQSKLNMPVEAKDNQLPMAKKSIIMLYLRKRLHVNLAQDAKSKGCSATKLAGEIVMSTDLSKLNIQYSNAIVDEVMVPSSFNISTECRLKLYKEIARRMLSKPTGIGKSEISNIGEVMNEIFAHHYNLPLPTPKIQEQTVDNEQIKFTITMPTELHTTLKQYCEQQSSSDSFLSMNATIVKWIEETAENEFW